MTYRKIDYLVELRRLARGKKTVVPSRDVPERAEQWVKAGLAQTDIEQLERIYGLQAPGGPSGTFVICPLPSAPGRD